MATIRDVAARARVSTGTVSNVLNRSAEVGPALRKRVNAAIRELEYHRDEVARSLRIRQTNVVGMVVPNVSDPFFPTVVRGVEDTLDRRGYTLIVGNSDSKLDKERKYYQTFMGKKVDGLVMIISPAQRAPEYLVHHKSNKVPIVYVGRMHPELQGDSVMLDDLGGSQQAVSHLLQRGHRRIGVVTGPLDLLDARLRLQGYKLALQERGIWPEEELIRQGHYDVRSGYEQTKALISLSPRPTGLFSSNHQMTIGCFQALAEAGMHSGEVALVSFDDLEWFSLLRPSITAIRQPAYDLGAVAADVLVQRLTRESTGPPHCRVIQGELIIRESSKSPACQG
jgi:LacI family transcriptional regulator